MTVCSLCLYTVKDDLFKHVLKMADLGLLEEFAVQSQEEKDKSEIVWKALIWR